MEDNEEYSSVAMFPCESKQGTMLRMVFLDPRIDESEDGSLLTNVIMTREGAEVFLDALAEQIDQIWG